MKLTKLFTLAVLIYCGSVSPGATASKCPHVWAATNKILGNLPLHRQRLLSAVNAKPDHPSMRFQVSKRLQALGVDIREGLAWVAFDVNCPSLMCVAMRQLIDLIRAGSAPVDLEAQLLAWFSKHLPDFQPVFGRKLDQLVKQNSTDQKMIMDGSRGIIVPPAIYSDMMLSGKIPVNDIHDLLAHLPMLLNPHIKKQVLKHFKVTKDFVAGKANPLLTVYGTLRKNYYEQFMYFDQESKTFSALGGLGGLLKYVAYDTFLGATALDYKSKGFSDNLIQYHAAWGQKPEMLARLQAKIIETAPVIMREVPQIHILSTSHKENIVWLFASEIVESDPILSQYFSLEHQLALWDQALEQITKLP